MIEEKGRLNSVADAVSLLGAPPEHWSDIDESVSAGPTYRYPFGLWFRGENREYSGGNLVPGVFRKSGKQIYDEISMYNMFRLRASRYRKENRSTFDWLCLMQHYGLPTRLIDWTESPLVSLYFAVRNEEYHNDEDDAFIFVLDARRLNRMADVVESPIPSGIHVPESFNVVIRAECADRPILASLLGCKAVTECDQTDAMNIPDLEEIALDPDSHVDFLRRLRMPVSVYPFRSNGRMVAQYGLFTVHGGKLPQDPPRAEGRTVDKPIHLAEMNSHVKDPVVWKYRVSANAKSEIKDVLERLGVHEGTLFPEIDQQAAYSKRLWMVKEGP